MGETREAPEARWYVIQTKPRKEALVERNLSVRGVAVFEPRIVAPVRAGRHVQQRAQPMFPGYVFARLELGIRAIAVRYVIGVRDFLRSEGEPQPVPDAIVAVLRERVGPEGVFRPAPPSFLPGERVRIEDGPFHGLEAIFERELSGPERVAVLLASMDLAARVILPGRALVAA